MGNLREGHRRGIPEGACEVFERYDPLEGRSPEGSGCPGGARSDLLRVFYSGGVTPEPASTVNVENLMQSWRSPPEEQDFQSIIQRAAQAAEEARQARDMAQGRPDHPAAPATPTFGAPPPGLGPAPGMHPTGLEAGMTGPGEGVIDEDTTMEYSSYTARDPYMTRPSSTHAVPGHPSPSQHYKAPDGTRVSVKTRRPTPGPDLGGVPLGTKLDAKRVALAPFGIGPAVGAGHAVPGDTAAPSTAASTSAVPASTAKSEEPQPVHVPFLSQEEIRARMAGFVEHVVLDTPEESDV